MNKIEYMLHILRHDLGNNFNHVIGFLSLYNDISEEENRDILKMLGKKAQKSAQDAWDLIDEMILWSSNNSIEKKCFSLFDECQESIVFFDGHYPETVSFCIENTIPKDLEVFSDKVIVKTIFRNLIGNAIKFSQPNSKIIISIEAGEIPQEKISISIKDNGIGIPEEIKEKIFLPEESKVRKDTFGNKSTGLGMVMIKDLIDALGEEIFLESEEGKGTTFFFTLPLPVEATV
jgi:signal transduction histidine kinase